MKHFLIIFFIFFIYTPILGLIFSVQDGLESTEKRNLAGFPKFKTINQFSDDFLKYYEDNFGFRYTFMKFASNLKVKIFKTYPKSIDLKVLRGKNGWLFYKRGNETEDFEGRVPFAKSSLIKIVQNQKERVSYLNQISNKKIKFYTFIPPDKTVVYSEYLPHGVFLNKNEQNSRITQLLNTGIEIIYPKNSIIKNKDKGLLYFKTDTHWSYLGAYFGYRALMEEISKDFNVKTLELSDFTKETYINESPDLLDIVNVGTKKSETGYKYNCKNNITKSNLRIIIFGDSFLEYLKPYLECTFQNISINPSGTLDRGLIEKFNPDVVILEIVQRNIKQLENKDK